MINRGIKLRESDTSLDIQPNPVEFPPVACVFCGQIADGNFSIHRDGFGVGPEVPLCDACGGSKTPTMLEIWDRIAQPRDGTFAHRRTASANTYMTTGGSQDGFSRWSS